MIQTGHARQADLERDRDVALGLFSAPPRGLRQHFHQRRARIRIRLDVELAVCGQPQGGQDGGAGEHQQGHSQGGDDDPLDHLPFLEIGTRSHVDGRFASTGRYSAIESLSEAHPVSERDPREQEHEKFLPLPLSRSPR